MQCSCLLLGESGRASSPESEIRCMQHSLFKRFVQALTQTRLSDLQVMFASVIGRRTHFCAEVTPLPSSRLRASHVTYEIPRSGEFFRVVTE